MVLVAVLMGLVVFNFTGWHESRKLKEGALQVEAMIRLARAEAANQGRRFRLACEAETGQLKVLWEADPLAQPGRFAEYQGSAWAADVPNDLVRVTRCQLTGPGAFRTLNLEQMKEPREDVPEPVTFYPDGSSDSAVIELAKVDADMEDPSQAYRAILELDGLNGVITTRFLTPTEYEEYRGMETDKTAPREIVPPEPAAPAGPPPAAPPPGKIRNRPSADRPSLIGAVPPDSINQVHVNRG